MLNDSVSVNESVVVRSLSGVGSVSADLTLHAKKDSASFDTRLGSCLSVLANASVGGAILGLGSHLLRSSLSVRSMAR